MLIVGLVPVLNIVKYLLQGSIKVVKVDWLGNLANYKQGFMLCARSRLGSFVLGVMLHYSIGQYQIYHNTLCLSTQNFA